MRRWLERVRPGCDAFLVSFALVVRPRYWIGAYEGKGARGGYAYLHTAIDGFGLLGVFRTVLVCVSGCLLQVQEIAFGLVRGAIP